MLLKDRLAAHGAFLFRWRSFLPLALVLPALVALPQSGYMEHWFGELAEGIWDVVCVLVAFAGLAVRVATVGFAPAGTSGRNTKGQRAETLNTTGLYSVVRNPLYLGNAITLFGFVLAVKVWWLALIALPCVLLYYERIVYAEEAYLQTRFGAAYEAWAAGTPALLPNPRLWRRPALPFSVRMAVRREYHGFFLVVVVMTLIEAVSDIVGEGNGVAQWLREDSGWLVFLLIGTIAYVTVRVIRKRTTWLVVPGR